MSTTTERSDAPIYTRLVHERGDIPTEVRRIAEEIWREVSPTMNFHLPRPSESHPLG